MPISLTHTKGPRALPITKLPTICICKGLNSHLWRDISIYGRTFFFLASSHYRTLRVSLTYVKLANISFFHREKTISKECITKPKDHVQTEIDKSAQCAIRSTRRPLIRHSWQFMAVLSRSTVVFLT